MDEKEKRIRQLLCEKNLLPKIKFNDMEISDFLDKKRIISIHKTRLEISQNISTKRLYKDLIQSLENYSGKNILLVFVKYDTFQHTYFIDEDIKSVLCRW